MKEKKATADPKWVRKHAFYTYTYICMYMCTRIWIAIRFSADRIADSRKQNRKLCIFVDYLLWALLLFYCISLPLSPSLSICLGICKFPPLAKKYFNRLIYCTFGSGATARQVKYTKRKLAYLRDAVECTLSLTASYVGSRERELPNWNLHSTISNGLSLSKIVGACRLRYLPWSFSHCRASARICKVSAAIQLEKIDLANRLWDFHRHLQQHYGKLVVTNPCIYLYLHGCMAVDGDQTCRLAIVNGHILVSSSTGSVCIFAVDEAVCLRRRFSKLKGF